MAAEATGDGEAASGCGAPFGVTAAADAWRLLALDPELLNETPGALAFLDDPDLPRLAAEARAAGLHDALIVATCERLEIFCADPAPNEERAGRLLASWVGRASLPAGALRRLEGEAALRHLFRVAAALESRVPGEPQVLGQVKDCHRAAREAGLLGARADAAAQAALSVAKRVRSETGLAQQPVSIAAAALRIARQVHGDLSECRLLMAGLGEMSDLLAEQFQAAGVRRMALTHPTERRGAAFARRLGAELHPWSGLEAALSEAEIVVAALGAGRYTVTREMMRAALRRRRQAPMFVIDAAVPRDVEPAVEDLDQAYVYDLADLERVVAAGHADRAAAARAAEALLEDGLADFLRRREERAAVPAVQALREHVEALRREILSDPRLDAEAATRLLGQRLLHGPMTALRAAAAEDPDQRRALEAALARLFPLEAGTGAGDDGDAGTGNEDEKP